MIFTKNFFPKKVSTNNYLRSLEFHTMVRHTISRTINFPYLLELTTQHHSQLKNTLLSTQTIRNYSNTLNDYKSNRPSSQHRNCNDYVTIQLRFSAVLFFDFSESIHQFFTYKLSCRSN
jgi:hypothetical protein